MMKKEEMLNLIGEIALKHFGHRVKKITISKSTVHCVMLPWRSGELKYRLSKIYVDLKQLQIHPDVHCGLWYISYVLK